MGDPCFLHLYRECSIPKSVLQKLKKALSSYIFHNKSRLENNTSEQGQLKFITVFAMVATPMAMLCVRVCACVCNPQKIGGAKTPSADCLLWPCGPPYLYQVINGHLNFPTAPIVPRNLSRSLRNTSTLALERPVTRTNAHQSSFFPHTIALWNSLPPPAQNCQSLHSFKQTVLRHTLNTSPNT